MAIMILTTIITLSALYVNQMKSPPELSVLAVGESMGLKTMSLTGHAVARGSFVQWWLVDGWDDEKWLKEYQAMKEAGMEYIILAPTVLRKYDKKTGTVEVKALYPTKIKDFKTTTRGDKADSVDVVDACLRNAQKTGIKVFLGLNFSEEWWSKRLDTGWVYDRMMEGNRIADELWEMYYSKYPDAFYGWYWCWEADNGNFRSLDLVNSKKLLADAISMQLDHFERTGKRLPFMLAPFIDWKLSTPRGFAKMWEYVFEHSGMKAGDIIAPQDSIGAGGLTLDNCAKWFAELRKAVDTVPGLKLWVTAETFDIKDWTAAPLDRFVKQMNKLMPYADNIITFSYNHYYSPNIVDSRFHATYLEYVDTGALETEPPSAPEGLKAQTQPGGKVTLEWDPSTDNVGVCGYYVYRNGKRIANLQVKRKDGMETEQDADTFMTDTGLEIGEKYKYEVQAYDFAGNTSPKAGPVTVVTYR